jgi:hypothetical protein
MIHHLTFGAGFEHNYPNPDKVALFNLEKWAKMAVIFVAAPNANKLHKEIPQNMTYLGHTNTQIQARQQKRADSSLI